MSQTNGGKLLYEGKAKRLYEWNPESKEVRMEFKDSLTAFNAQKRGEFCGKGQINRNIASLLFRYLAKKGVESHWVADRGTNEMITKQVQIITIEVVVRNVLAGSLAKKLNLEEGRQLKWPIVEFYFKNDELGDPLLCDDHVLMLELVNESELKVIKDAALKINTILRDLFQKINIQLVDFKVEFGKDSRNQIILADEITPDCCRLWDTSTGDKLDKDRFRRDLGRVEESYVQVLERLKGILA